MTSDSRSRPASISDAFAAAQVLTPLSPRWRTRLALSSKQLKVSRGVRIFEQGEVMQHALFVISGRLMYTRGDYEGGSTLRYQAPGELGDIVAALDGRESLFDVTATCDTIVALIPYSELYKAVLQEPAFLFALVKLLCTQTRTKFKSQ